MKSIKTVKPEKRPDIHPYAFGLGRKRAQRFIVLAKSSQFVVE